MRRWLPDALLAIAASSSAYFDCHPVASAGDIGRGARVAVVLAYPAALFGLCGLVATASYTRRTRLRLWVAGLAFALPASLLLLVRLARLHTAAPSRSVPT